MRWRPRTFELPLRAVPVESTGAGIQRYIATLAAVDARLACADRFVDGVLGSECQDVRFVLGALGSKRCLGLEAGSEC